MFSKFTLGMLIAVTLVFAGFWILKMVREGENKGNGLSSNVKATVTNKTKKPNYQNKQTTKNRKVKTKKRDRTLTPDELYEQQFVTNQAEFELAPTSPEIEVMPEELRIVEEEAAIVFGQSSTFDADVMADNPEPMIGNVHKDDLPPSESFKEVIPFELEQIESNISDVVDN